MARHGWLPLTLLCCLCSLQACSRGSQASSPENVVRAVIAAINEKNGQAIYDYHSTGALEELENGLAEFKKLPPEHTEQICSELGVSQAQLETMSAKDFFLCNMKYAFDRIESLTLKALKTDIVEDTASVRTSSVLRNAGGERQVDGMFILVEEDGMWKLRENMLTDLIASFTRDPGESAAIQVKMDFLVISDAIQFYRLDTGEYPEKLGGLVEDPGVKGWKGPYIKGAPTDPWGNAYIYKLTEYGQAPYELRTLGADAAPGGIGKNADHSNLDSE
jgi:type II secretion system protein G